MSALKGITKKGGKRTKHGGLWAEGEGKNPKKIRGRHICMPPCGLVKELSKFRCNASRQPWRENQLLFHWIYNCNREGNELQTPQYIYLGSEKGFWTAIYYLLWTRLERFIVESLSFIPSALNCISSISACYQMGGESGAVLICLRPPLVTDRNTELQTFFARLP